MTPRKRCLPHPLFRVSDSHIRRYAENGIPCATALLNISRKLARNRFGAFASSNGDSVNAIDRSPARDNPAIRHFAILRGRCFGAANRRALDAHRGFVAGDFRAVSFLLVFWRQVFSHHSGRGRCSPRDDRPRRMVGRCTSIRTKTYPNSPVALCPGKFSFHRQGSVWAHSGKLYPLESVVAQHHHSVSKLKFDRGWADKDICPRIRMYSKVSQSFTRRQVNEFK